MNGQFCPHSQIRNTSMKTFKNRKAYKIDIRAIITLKGKERIILLFEETEIRDFFNDSPHSS